ncbi:GGDEF domain-containing protein [Vibrio maerlii]|uniref:GGDEF domain-containing protein n=1 Tax=Vibrio maerlii TaxID=2231648 RepID=UPI0013DEDD7A|nr:GGDEF domain-containing protein [Vibrio maerlii]
MITHIQEDRVMPLSAKIQKLGLTNELSVSLSDTQLLKFETIITPISLEICRQHGLKCQPGNGQCTKLAQLFTHYITSCFDLRSQELYKTTRQALCEYFFHESVQLTQVIAIVGDFQILAIERLLPEIESNNLPTLQLALLRLFNLDLQIFCEYYTKQQQQTEWVDPLTNLMNEKAFDAEFDRIISMSGRLEFHTSLLAINIVQFAKINSRYGRDEGDELLQLIADSLLEHTRMSDYVARLYDDKFAIILPNTPIENTAILCERLIERIETKSDLDVMLSIGGAEFTPDKQHTLEDVFYTAQERMKEAKSDALSAQSSKQVISDKRESGNVVHFSFRR